MEGDLLAGAIWEWCSTSPGECEGPSQIASTNLAWQRTSVPGTAASAVRAMVGADPDGWDYDQRDWWFRARFKASEGRFSLRAEGLATIANVWLNGQQVLHSENMFRAHTVDVGCTEGDNELLVLCSALTPVLERRRPRPRWRTRVTTHHNLRWVRTSLIGRTPGWTLTPPVVGPWRPVQLWPAQLPVVLSRRALATCDDNGNGGTVAVALRLSGPVGDAAFVEVGDVRGSLAISAGPGYTELHGSVHLDRVERWWPATHGAQPLYPVVVRVGGLEVPLSPVGFRTVEVDTSGDGFSFSVNGLAIFCRGAVWWPTDPVSASSPRAEMKATLELALASHMNMVRICGLGTYETEEFWELCDQMGLLVWQDCMIGFGDPPEEPEFVGEVTAEIMDNLSWLGGHPSLAVLCGSLQVHEQAEMMTGRTSPPKCPLLDEVIPKLAADLLPGVPYIPSTPWGGEQAFYVNKGVAHYYGVGMYLRDPIDARLSGVRFAAECLFMATPPEPATVERCGGAERAGHHPDWKRAVHIDPGRSWDKEDLRDYYVRKVLGADPDMLRYSDPERALDAGRACNAHILTLVFSEWRRSGSCCRGGMVLGLRDQRLGAGWGLVDALGVPKSTWYAFRRAARPLTVLITDEGLQGLLTHVVNETRTSFSGRLRLQLFAGGVPEVAREEIAVALGPNETGAFPDTEILQGFRDAGYSYRFGPPQHDLVVATLYDSEGGQAGQAFHFPLGVARPVEEDLGLRAEAHPADGGSWLLEISTVRLAQWVVPRVRGYRPTDAWFHLAPAGRCQVRLEPVAPSEGEPRGSVWAWNMETSVPISVG